jgi:endonuclease/exonuclease/phosphatase family metal-dependent hydrolase
MRVLTYNIHKGFRMGNRHLVLSEIRDNIRKLGADLVFLQEVLGNHEKHPTRFPNYPSESQFEFLADSVWPHFAYGKNAQYSEGHHGNAILSRLPILSWNNLDLSTHRWERRGLLHAVIQDPSAPPSLSTLNVFCLHLDLFEGSRRKQVQTVVEYIKANVLEDDRVILAGDFNDWRTSISRTLQNELGLREAYKELHGNYAKTFPSVFPVMRLDRIYFRHMKLVDSFCLEERHWSRLSDHRPLIAEFQNQWAV